MRTAHRPPAARAARPLSSSQKPRLSSLTSRHPFAMIQPIKRYRFSQHHDMHTPTLNEPRPGAVDSTSAAASRWSVEAVESLYALPFNDLVYRAQTVHREHFDANCVQLSTLLSIKTGGCPEDCG